jgi:hypothetical protein
VEHRQWRNDTQTFFKKKDHHGEIQRSGQKNLRIKMDGCSNTEITVNVASRSYIKSTRFTGSILKQPKVGDRRNTTN